MDLPESSQQLVAPITTALEEVFGLKLASAVIHGSGVTGDILPLLSDLDVVVILNQRWQLREAASLHELVSKTDATPFSRIQPKFIDLTNAPPLLVEGTYAVLFGNEPPNQMILTRQQLIDTGEKWLHDLPSIIRSDAEEWSMATGPTVTRLGRLISTRLKPGVRAYLVRTGNNPPKVWAMLWDEMANMVKTSDIALGRAIDSFLAHARTEDTTMDELGTLAFDAAKQLLTLI